MTFRDSQTNSIILNLKINTILKLKGKKFEVSVNELPTNMTRTQKARLIKIHYAKKKSDDEVFGDKRFLKSIKFPNTACAILFKK